MHQCKQDFLRHSLDNQVSCPADQPGKKLRLSRSMCTIFCVKGVVRAPPVGLYSGSIRVVLAAFALPRLYGRNGIHPSFGVVFGWYSRGIRWYSPCRGCIVCSQRANTSHLTCPEHHGILHGHDMHMKVCVGWHCQEKWYSLAPVALNIILRSMQKEKLPREAGFTCILEF